MHKKLSRANRPLSSLYLCYYNKHDLFHRPIIAIVVKFEPCFAKGPFIIIDFLKFRLLDEIVLTHPPTQNFVF
jgi:hypothetical protein